MPRQHYSSPITAVRQWRGYDATANVFNDVNRHLCDDSVFCLDGEGFALRTPAPQQGNTVLVATLAYEVKR